MGDADEEVSDTTPEHKKRPAWPWIVGLVAFLGAIGGLVAVLASSGGPSGHTILGGIMLTDSSGGWGQVGSACEGSGGYTDMVPGADVVVTDENNKVIGTGSLTDGATISSTECHFAFSVPKVSTAKFYKVAVSHRGGITKSQADMVAAKWTIELTLGNA